MTCVFSKPERADKKAAERIQNHVLSFPFSIAFSKSKRTNAKHDTTDFRQFRMRFDLPDENSRKKKKSVIIFEGHGAKIWCEWCSRLNKLFRLALLTIAIQKVKTIVSLLRSKGLERYNMDRK
jgi:hypothetical protein